MAVELTVQRPRDLLLRNLVDENRIELERWTLVGGRTEGWNSNVVVQSKETGLAMPVDITD